MQFLFWLHFSSHLMPFPLRWSYLSIYACAWPGMAWPALLKLGQSSEMKWAMRRSYITKGTSYVSISILLQNYVIHLKQQERGLIRRKWDNGFGINWGIWSSADIYLLKCIIDGCFKQQKFGFLLKFIIATIFSVICNFFLCNFSGREGYIKY